MTKTMFNSNQQQGFGLIEVLITVVILAIGLLGLAGLQATGLNFNHSAYQRSQATTLAYDIIDRMRANPVAIDSYRTAAPQVVAACTGSGCSPAQMAQNDLAEWNAILISTFGNTVAPDITIAGTVYTVSITWDENRDGLVDANDPDFEVSFQP
tara:strand:- start:2652 stop:3113 length:462 start_codon:yes stop_codon:yes gene_type:complete